MVLLYFLNPPFECLGIVQGSGAGLAATTCNAALMLAQMGDEAGAMAEMQKVAR